MGDGKGFTGPVHAVRLSGSGIYSMTAFPAHASAAKVGDMERVDHEFIPLPVGLGESDFIAALNTLMRRLGDRGLVVVGVPGPVRGNHVQYWSQLSARFGELLEEALQSRRQRQFIDGDGFVFVNNTTLLAEYLLYHGCVPRRSAIVVSVGSGIGSGLILDGRVFAGQYNRAGEIGHLPLVLNGHPCPCGRLGCLERYIGGAALVEWARRQDIVVSHATDLLNIETVAVREIFDKARMHLASRLAWLVGALDVRDVILSGDLVDFFGVEAMQGLLQAEVLFEEPVITVRRSPVPAWEGVLLGGIRQAIGMQTGTPIAMVDI